MQIQTSLNPFLKQASAPQTIVEHLSIVINRYLEKNPRLSLNALSKRCKVSEPTLRRISKQDVKTEPNKGTILDILTTISRESDIGKLVEIYDGPIGDYLRKVFPYSNTRRDTYSRYINSHLSDPAKYIIYLLSLNDLGVTFNKIRSLFGDFGIADAKYLVKQELVVETKPGTLKAKVETFCGPLGDDFVFNFKTLANFIKPHKVQCSRKLNPFFRAETSGVSPEAYEAIVKVQSAAIKKIQSIINDDKGDPIIPLMVLTAIDTIDSQSANDIYEESQSQKGF